jgi:hypothetical protein
LYRPRSDPTQKQAPNASHFDFVQMRAVSVASILLLTEATTTEILEDRKEQVTAPEMAL